MFHEFAFRLLHGCFRRRRTAEKRTQFLRQADQIEWFLKARESPGRNDLAVNHEVRVQQTIGLCGGWERQSWSKADVSFAAASLWSAKWLVKARLPAL